MRAVEASAGRSLSQYSQFGRSCSAITISIADQIAGRNLGYINPALYEIANDPGKYAADFFDVTVNCNGSPSIPGYCASRGWDAVTGLGTPNAANLIPDLIAAIPPPP